MDISIIIPTLNEEENIDTILGNIRREMGERDEEYEILVVDAYSDDSTQEIAEENGCRVILQEGGKGAAIKRGLKEAQGDIIVTIDADLSHRATELGLLIEGIDSGYDLCLGSRFIQGGGTNDMPIHRYMGNRFFVFLVNLIWRTNLSDLCYGYRSFRADAFADVDLKSTGFDIETEFTIRAAKNNLKMLEVPSFEKQRQGGNAKLKTFSDGWRILHTILHEAVN